MRYLIVGAGPAGVIAAETIREWNRDAQIILFGNEPDPPYSRMAIPYWLVGQIDEAGTHLRRTPEHYHRLGIEVRHERALAVDPARRTLSVERGEALHYDRLLIATGSRPMRPPIEGMDLPNVESCWTLADARRIASKACDGSRVVLLGAGFIGCIVLEALAARGVSLTVVEREDRMVPRMMDATGGELLRSWCNNRGVRVLTGASVTAVAKRGDKLNVRLDTGEDLVADLVVCATGVKPNLELAENAGLETEAGVLVDEYLATSVPGIFAAGDVAQGPVFGTSRRQVHAIQPTAAEHGRIAALNMTGKKTAYRGSLSMNVLNTLGLVSCSFGEWMGVEGGDRAQIVDREASRYLRLELCDNVLVGAIGLGFTEHVGMLRGLILSKIPLGAWKERILSDPNQIAAAYLECARA